MNEELARAVDEVGRVSRYPRHVLSAVATQLMGAGVAVDMATDAPALPVDERHQWTAGELAALRMLLGGRSFDDGTISASDITKLRRAGYEVVSGGPHGVTVHPPRHMNRATRRKRAAEARSKRPKRRARH